MCGLSPVGNDIKSNCYYCYYFQSPWFFSLSLSFSPLLFSLTTSREKDEDNISNIEKKKVPWLMSANTDRFWRKIIALFSSSSSFLFFPHRSSWAIYSNTIIHQTKEIICHCLSDKKRTHNINISSANKEQFSPDRTCVLNIRKIIVPARLMQILIVTVQEGLSLAIQICP